MNAIHSLSQKDEVARTATCSICGPVSIRPAGRGWVCLVKHNANRRRSRLASPDRGAKSRGKKTPSAHRLQNRTGGQDVCAVCGPVTSIPQGRGWMCPTRARELGWVKTPAAPQPKCDRCLEQYLTAAGTCPACDDPMNYSVSYGLRAMALSASANAASDIFTSYVEAGDDDNAGFSVSPYDPPLPGDEERSVTPWLKTIGSYAPSGSRPAVLPAYAALYKGGVR